MRSRSIAAGLLTRAGGMALVACYASHGVQAAALPDHDLSPLIATLGLPRADESARLLDASGWRWRTSVATASHSTQETAGSESMLFDGETTRVAVAFDYGLNNRWQVGIELPFLWNESGGLDSTVRTWHDWFGFPNGLRNRVAENSLDFLYRDDGVDRLAFRQNQHGLGDVRVLAAWQWQRDAKSAAALRLSVQLPTGDSDKLTGSGAAALSVGVAGDRDELFESPRWSGFYRASLLYRGKPDRLADRARRTIASIAGGVSLRAHARLEFTMQGTLRSAAYDSDLRLLGDPALLLNVGGTIALSDTLQLAVAVGEDVRVNTAPDVTFALSLQYRPPGK